MAAADMRLVAFLRAINVGGHTVTMARLKELFLEMGFSDVETFIASGNVIFTSRSKDPAAAEKKIESHLKKVLGYEVRTFVRSDREVAGIAAATPFPAAVRKAARTLLVGFIDAPLSIESAKTWLALETKEDRFNHTGRELYWLCAGGQSESKYFNVSFEKLLATSITFRNMNTVAKIAAKWM